MRPTGDTDSSDGWLSASDLADFAYCPRSFWYRHHPPLGGPSPEADGSRARGMEYHRSVLAAAERRWKARRAAWAALGVAIVLIAVGLFAVLSG